MPARQIDMWKQGQFCDATITVEGRDFEVHRMTVSGSDFLYSAFTSGLAESDSAHVALGGELKALAVEAVLNFLYTGECEMSDTASEVLPLLGLTDEYLLPDLQRVCEDQIIDYMDVKTATTILTDPNSVLPETSEKSVREAAKAVFLEEYDRLLDEDETDESEGEAPADAFKAKRAMLVTGPPPLGAAYDDEDESDEDDEDDEAEAPVAEAPAAAAAPGTYDDDEFDEA